MDGDRFRHVPASDAIAFNIVPGGDVPTCPESSEKTDLRSVTDLGRGLAEPKDQA